MFLAKDECFGVPRPLCFGEVELAWGAGVLKTLEIILSWS